MYMNEIQIVKLKDSIYDCSQHIKALELELDEKTFKHKCIPQKKEEEKSTIIKCIVPLILLTALAVVGIIQSISHLRLILLIGSDKSPGLAVGLLGYLICAAVGIYYGVMLWRDFLRRAAMLRDLQILERKLGNEIECLQSAVLKHGQEKDKLEKKLEEEEREQTLSELSPDAKIDSGNLRKYLDFIFVEAKCLEKRIGAPEVINELWRFGFKTLGDISTVLTGTVAEMYVPEEMTNYAGVLRNIMIIQDCHKYFTEAYRGGWTQTTYERMRFWKDKGVEDIENYLKEYEIEVKM